MEQKMNDLQSKNQPLGGNVQPRFSGPGTFMRLPSTENLEGLDVAFLGIPMDIGTSWRSGTRFGPKQIRAESNMLRPYNMWTKAAPFDFLNCADIGDVPINTFDLKDSVLRITSFYDNLLKYPLVPMALGGDHTLTLPILRSIKKKFGPVALIHIDAHADINDEMFGEKIAHESCTVVDDGTLNERRGSLSVDDEGTSSNCTTLIENGYLRGYLHDRQNAGLMGSSPTGNGRRQSYAHRPMPRMTNTYMRPGAHPPEEILKSVKKGLDAVSFGGGQVDITNG